ncbi:hypothetical protein BDF21DRAFT_333528 [Thamnidium elegans]|nr:hypothetical protein BDF21DRAFT_333528 [Thamnidium elegans]
MSLVGAIYITQQSYSQSGFTLLQPSDRPKTNCSSRRLLIIQSSFIEIHNISRIIWLQKFFNFPQFVLDVF